MVIEKLNIVRVEEARKQNEVWSQHMEKMANNADLNSENKQALVLFKEQNQQMQNLIVNSQNSAASAAQKDDIASELYAIKQQKQSKF